MQAKGKQIGNRKLRCAFFPECDAQGKRLREIRTQWNGHLFNYSVWMSKINHEFWQSDDERNCFQLSVRLIEMKSRKPSTGNETPCATGRNGWKANIFSGTSDCTEAFCAVTFVHGAIFRLVRMGHLAVIENIELRTRRKPRGETSTQKRLKRMYRVTVFS